MFYYYLSSFFLFFCFLWIWVTICYIASFCFNIIWGELSLSTEPLLCVCYICSANACNFPPDIFQVPSTQSSYCALMLGSVDAKSLVPLLPFNIVRWAVVCGSQSSGKLDQFPIVFPVDFCFFILWELCFWKDKKCNQSPVVFGSNAISHIFIWLVFVQADSFSKYLACRISSTAYALFITVTFKLHIRLYKFY